MTKTKRYRWYYVGDVNPEYGGYWFNLSGLKWGYVDVVRVTPWSDAGGPDNGFWVECLTVNMPTDDQTKACVLTCIGQTLESIGNGAQSIRVLIDACIAYGQYDPDGSETVRIGKPCTYSGSSGFDPIEPNRVLRSGSSLANYIRREYLAMVQG
jgi:hypothetical protein